MAAKKKTATKKKTTRKPSRTSKATAPKGKVSKRTTKKKAVPKPAPRRTPKKKATKPIVKPRVKVPAKKAPKPEGDYRKLRKWTIPKLAVLLESPAGLRKRIQSKKRGALTADELMEYLALEEQIVPDWKKKRMAPGPKGRPKKGVKKLGDSPKPVKNAKSALKAAASGSLLGPRPPIKPIKVVPRKKAVKKAPAKAAPPRKKRAVKKAAPKAPARRRPNFKKSTKK